MGTEMDYRCGKGRVVETDDWQREHAQHGKPEKSFNEHQPRGYRLYTMKCPCGARHIFSEGLDLSAFV